MSMTFFAFLLVIASSLIQSSWNLLAKKVSHNMTITWLGMGGIAALLLPYIYYMLGTKGFFTAALYSIPTGCIHALYVFMLLRGYQQWDISLIYPISRGSAVALAAIWTSLFLHQPKSLIGLLGIGLTVIGILWVGINIKQWIKEEHQHPKHHHHGLMWALALGIIISSYFTLDAMLVQTIHPIAYLGFMDFYMWIFLLPYVLIYKKQDLKAAWANHKILITYIGIASNLSYLLILTAFTMGAASYVVALRESSIIFVTLGGAIFLKEPVSLKKGFGILIILAGALLIKFA